MARPRRPHGTECAEFAGRGHGVSPFSGDEDDQTEALSSESAAYIALIKAMTPVSFKRIPDQVVPRWLAKHGLEHWQDEAESVLTFNSPALAITGKPAEIELDIEYERRHYRILGPNPAGGMDTETLQTASGRIGKGIIEVFDDHRNAIDFMIAHAQLKDMAPQSRYDRVETRYRVRKLSLTYTVDVWQREDEQYQSQKVTQVMEDLDIEWKAS